MTMVIGRPLFGNDSLPRGFSIRDSSRPTLKMPCSRYSSSSFDSGKMMSNAYESRVGYSSSSYSSHSPFSLDVASSSSSAASSSRINTGLVALSTPSPSATANGNRVDIEFEKFRRLSEEWIRNREIEEAENQVHNLGSRSPSPQRIIPASKFFRRSSSQPAPENGYRDSRSPSPVRSLDSSFRSPSSPQRSESPFRSFRSRSPSPLIFSPVTKTFIRSNSYDPDSSFSSIPSRSVSPRESSLPPSVFRRSTSYEGENKYHSLPSRSPSPQRYYTPVSSIIFRRSGSYEQDDRIRSNFRSRSTSPQRLTPASSYYRKQGSGSSSGSEERENGIYSSSYGSRSPSSQNSSYLLNILNRNNNIINRPFATTAPTATPTTADSKLFNNNNHLDNLKNYYSDPLRNKFFSLPRNIFSTRANSPNNRKNLFNLFDQSSSASNNNNIDNDTTKRNGISPGFHQHPITNLSNSSNRFNNFHPNNFTSNNSSISKPPSVSSNRPSEKQFLQNTLPDLSNYRMNSPRRFSEEPSPFRRPLATLHEDEVMARRRFSDDLRKLKSFDTSDILSDYQDHQRKLSEAGVRKLSDASVVLTEDTDSFIIGDRVWVGGTKPGIITYIGETQFAPGEWAGITLDDPVGKNNGSVAGVRYFQCEAKKGVFSRLTRLSRSPLSDYDIEILAAKTSNSSKNTPLPSTVPGQLGRKITTTYQGNNDVFRKTSQPNESPRKITPGSPGNNSPLYGKSGSPSPSSSIKKGPLPSSVYNSDLRLGERVVIDSTTGTKYGVLRYLGEAEFAEGIWAGVELDDPSGKNDGSVAGKKYFVCRSRYGLFAPIARVKSFAHRSSVPRSSLPTLRRSGSRESLGGSSTVSSTVSSLRGTRKPSRTSTSGTSPSTKALQNHDFYENVDRFY